MPRYRVSHLTLDTGGEDEEREEELMNTHTHTHVKSRKRICIATKGLPCATGHETDSAGIENFLLRTPFSCSFVRSHISSGRGSLRGRGTQTFC